MDNWLKNNNYLKIVSVIIAIMLWLVVNLDPNAPSQSISNGTVEGTYFYNTKFVPIYNEDKYVLTYDSDDIKVNLKGNKDLINQVRQNNTKGNFYINMSEYQPGEYEVPIYYSGFPSGVIVDIQPKTVKVQLQPKYKKEFDVKIEKLGQEAEGVQIGDPKLTPNKVNVSGTNLQIDQIAVVKGFVNVSNITESIKQQVSLEAFDINGNKIDVEIEPEIIDVEVPVLEPNVNVPLSFEILNYPPDGYAIKSIQQVPSQITIYGPRDILSKYTTYKGPSIDLSNVTEDQQLRIEIPLDKGISRIEPNVIEYKIAIAPAQKMTIKQIPVEFVGLGEGLKAEFITPKDGTYLTLEGAREILDSLAKEDVQAFIDLTNLSPGEYEIPIQYKFPIYLLMVSDGEIAKVKITEELANDNTD